MRFLILFLFPLLIWECSPKKNHSQETVSPRDPDGWTELFNHQDLSGWKIAENEASFRVENGLLIAQGERAHLFYEGEALESGFDHFELEAELRTSPGANSGIYFHTKFQEAGWPSEGFEVQVNQSHVGLGDYRELKKSGSLYGTRNTYFSIVDDNQWYKTHIIVNGDRVQIFIDDVLTVDYYQFFDGDSGKKLGKGTFAIQCHDPESRVEYRSLKVRRLAEEASTVRFKAPGEWLPRMLKLQREKQIPFIDLNPDLEEDEGIDNRIENGFVTGVNVGFIWDEHLAEEMNLSYLDRSIVLGKRYGEDLADDKITYTIADASLEVIDSLIENKLVDIIAVSSQEEEDRLMPLLEKIGANGLAIQIDNALKLPGKEFICKASQAACLFSFRGISSLDLPGNSTYFLDVTESCDIPYKQFFIPKRNLQ